MTPQPTTDMTPQRREAITGLLESTVMMDQYYRDVAMFRHRVDIRRLGDEEIDELHRVIKEVNAIMSNASMVHSKIADAMQRRVGERASRLITPR